MSDIRQTRNTGILRDGWTGSVEDYALSCNWSKDGNVLMACDVMGGIKAFHGKSGELFWECSDTHDSGLLATSINPEGTLFATSGQDGNIMIWSVEKGTPEAQINLGSGWAENLVWSEDGDCLAATCSRHAYVFDKSGKEIWRSETHPSTVSAIAWSDKKELATASYGQVAFYDIEHSQLLQKFQWKGSLVSMVLSPDGDVVACGSQDNSVHFWRRSTAEDSMMSGYAYKPTDLDFDYSGTLLATGGSEVVTVWSFKGSGPEGTRPGQLELHSKPISSLCFAPKGYRLASGAKDGTVIIWDLNSDGEGNPIGAAMITEKVSDVAWRPDGRALAAVGSKGQVTTWRIRN